jgi:hypothetical protein
MGRRHDGDDRGGGGVGASMAVRWNVLLLVGTQERQGRLRHAVNGARTARFVLGEGGGQASFGTIDGDAIILTLI